MIVARPCAQAPGGHGRPTPAGAGRRAYSDTGSSGRDLLGDERCGFRSAAAASASPDAGAGRTAARSPRRGGRGRHWQGAAAATSGASADALPRSRHAGLRGSRSAPASAVPRTAASAARAAARRSAAGGMKVSGVAGSACACARRRSMNSDGFSAVDRTRPCLAIGAGGSGAAADRGVAARRAMALTARGRRRRSRRGARPDAAPASARSMRSAMRSLSARSLPASSCERGFGRRRGWRGSVSADRCRWRRPRRG